MTFNENSLVWYNANIENKNNLSLKLKMVRGLPKSGYCKKYTKILKNNNA